MATQKVTFSLPTSLMSQFTRQVPARERSRYVAEALAAKLHARDRILARACEIANRGRSVQKLERELDALHDEMLEPWDEPTSR